MVHTPTAPEFSDRPVRTPTSDFRAADRRVTMAAMIVAARGSRLAAPSCRG